MSHCDGRTRCFFDLQTAQGELFLLRAAIAQPLIFLVPSVSDTTLLGLAVLDHSIGGASALYNSMLTRYWWQWDGR